MTTKAICGLSTPLNLDGNLITDSTGDFMIEVVSLRKTGQECHDIAKRIFKLLNDTALSDSKIHLDPFSLDDSLSNDSKS